MIVSPDWSVSVVEKRMVVREEGGKWRLHSSPARGLRFACIFYCKQKASWDALWSKEKIDEDVAHEKELVVFPS